MGDEKVQKPGPMRMLDQGCLHHDESSLALEEILGLV